MQDLCSTVTLCGRNQSNRASGKIRNPVLSLPINTHKLILANGCRPQEEENGLPACAFSVLKSVHKAKTIHN